MKRIFRNAALIVLALMLFASQAAAQTYKDEVVYALLSATGDVKSIYVVNGFESQTQAEGKDYGAYSQTLPLTQAEQFSYQDGEAAFTMAPGRFFYQGTPEDKQLPWEIKLSYALDGKEITPEALSGASGELSITIQVTPSAQSAAFSQNLALTATLTLSGKRALNIQAESATLAIAGGDVTVSYVILPGQEVNYQISAQVQDFALPSAQFAAVRMGVDKAMYQNIATKALEGTPFAAAVGGMMEQFLAGMQGQPTASFMDSRNTVRSVQFVMLTEAIPELKPETTAAPAAQTQPDDTVWQRLLSLFGG